MTTRASAATYAGLAGEILAGPARLGNVRLVAVDGGTGTGKTTFASRLVAALTHRGTSTGVVHTDDLLDGWDDQLSFWPRLVSGVLEPLAAGEPGGHRRYDWARGRFADRVNVPVPEVLIVEGVSAARVEVTPWLTRSVFLVADPEVAFARVLARDGAGIEGDLRRWITGETRHFARDGTLQRADVLVDGGVTVGGDPEVGFPRLR